MNRLHLPLALFSAALACYSATQAHYAGVAWNFCWALLLFKFYIDTLQLDGWYIAVDTGRGDSFTVVAHGRVYSRLPAPPQYRSSLNL